MGRDDGRDMYRMDRDMSSMNRMGMDQQMYSNIMGRDMMGRNMMDRNVMDRNMMRNGMMGRRNMYNINQASGIMRQQMSSNLMGDMSSNNMMYRNMMGDMSSANMMRQGSDMMGRMNAYTTQGGLLGRQQQVMSQKMEMERIPETFTSTQFF